MEIKFNAWDKFEKKMILWKELVESENLISEVLLNSARYIPLLSSGEYDVEGKEIFVGDNYINPEIGNNDVYTVFQFKGSITGGKKLYNSSPLCWSVIEDDRPWNCELESHDCKWLKIVGNIYEGLKIDL